MFTIVINKEDVFNLKMMRDRLHKTINFERKQQPPSNPRRSQEQIDAQRELELVEKILTQAQ